MNDRKMAKAKTGEKKTAERNMKPNSSLSIFLSFP